MQKTISNALGRVGDAVASVARPIAEVTSGLLHNPSVDTLYHSVIGPASMTHAREVPEFHQDMFGANPVDSELSKWTRAASPFDAENRLDTGINPTTAAEYVVEKNPGPKKVQAAAAVKKAAAVEQKLANAMNKIAKLERKSIKGQSNERGLAPASTPNMGSRREQMAADGSMAVIEGSDRLGTITLNDATINVAGGVLLQYFFSPDQGVTLALQQYSRLFQKFEFLDVEVLFNGTLPTTYGGSVDVLFDNDPADVDSSGPALLQQLATTRQSHESPVISRTLWRWNMRKEAAGEFFVSNDTSSDAGKRITEQGHFLFVVANPISFPGTPSYPLTLGSLFIRYRVRFYHRQVVPGTTIGGSVAQLSFASGSKNPISGNTVASASPLWGSYCTSYSTPTLDFSGNVSAGQTALGPALTMASGTYQISCMLRSSIGPAVGAYSVLSWKTSGGVTFITDRDGASTQIDEIVYPGGTTGNTLTALISCNGTGTVWLQLQAFTGTTGFVASSTKSQCCFLVVPIASSVGSSRRVRRREEAKLLTLDDDGCARVRGDAALVSDMKLVQVKDDKSYVKIDLPARVTTPAPSGTPLRRQAVTSLTTGDDDDQYAGSQRNNQSGVRPRG